MHINLPRVPSPVELVKAVPSPVAVVRKVNPVTLTGRALRSVTPQTVRSAVKSRVRLAQGVILPHGLQSQSARTSRAGRLHTNRNAAIAGAVALGVATGGAGAVAMAAGTSAGVSAAMQYAATGRVNVESVAKAGVMGAATGGLGPAGYIVQNKLEGQSFDRRQALLSLAGVNEYTQTAASVVQANDARKSYQQAKAMRGQISAAQAELEKARAEASMVAQPPVQTATASASAAQGSAARADEQKKKSNVPALLAAGALAVKLLAFM